MNNNKIEAGDMITISWSEEHTLFKVTVLHAPERIGDSWILKRIDGQIVYVNRFDYMTLIKKGDDNEKEKDMEVLL